MAKFYLCLCCFLLQSIGSAALSIKVVVKGNDTYKDSLTVSLKINKRIELYKVSFKDETVITLPDTFHHPSDVLSFNLSEASNRFQLSGLLPVVNGSMHTLSCALGDQQFTDVQLEGPALLQDYMKTVTRCQALQNQARDEQDAAQQKMLLDSLNSSALQFFYTHPGDDIGVALAGQALQHATDRRQMAAVAKYLYEHFDTTRFYPAKLVAQLEMLTRNSFAVDWTELYKQENGETVSLQSVSGERTLIHFWASWCVPCKEEFPYLNQLAAAYPNLKIVHISIDESERQWKAYLKKNKISGAQLIANASTANKFGVVSIPFSFLMQDGELEARDPSHEELEGLLKK